MHLPTPLPAGCVLLAALAPLAAKPSCLPLCINNATSIPWTVRVSRPLTLKIAAPNSGAQGTKPRLPFGGYAFVPTSDPTAIRLPCKPPSGAGQPNPVYMVIVAPEGEALVNPWLTFTADGQAPVDMFLEGQSLEAARQARLTIHISPDKWDGEVTGEPLFDLRESEEGKETKETKEAREPSVEHPAPPARPVAMGLGAPTLATPVFAVPSPRPRGAAPAVPPASRPAAPAMPPASRPAAPAAIALQDGDLAALVLDVVDQARTLLVQDPKKWVVLPEVRRADLEGRDAGPAPAWNASNGNLATRSWELKLTPGFRYTFRIAKDTCFASHPKFRNALWLRLDAPAGVSLGPVSLVGSSAKKYLQKWDEQRMRFFSPDGDCAELKEIAPNHFLVTGGVVSSGASPSAASSSAKKRRAEQGADGPGKQARPAT